MSLVEKLNSLNVVLPKVSGPFGAYVRAKRVGSLVYVAGQLPMSDGKLLASGQVPSKCAIEQAKAAARQCVINGLAAAASVVPLEKITGVLRAGAFVASDADF